MINAQIFCLGMYLLQRQADTLSLLSAGTGKALVNRIRLDDMYSADVDPHLLQVATTRPPREYRGVDPHTLLVWHRVQSRLPATFTPRTGRYLSPLIITKIIALLDADQQPNLYYDRKDARQKNHKKKKYKSGSRMKTREHGANHIDAPQNENE
jgi:hypothetical protein